MSLCFILARFISLCFFKRHKECDYDIFHCRHTNGDAMLLFNMKKNIVTFQTKKEDI
jgi:hypothetical protein